MVIFPKTYCFIPWKFFVFFFF